METNVLLRQPQLVEAGAGGDLQLVGDNVNIGDLFGHRVLHLDTRVHLDKDMAALLIHEEFDGASATVVNVASKGYRVLADAFTLLSAE